MDDCSFLFAEGHASAPETCAANPEYCSHPDVFLPVLPLHWLNKLLVAVHMHLKSPVLVCRTGRRATPHCRESLVKLGKIPFHIRPRQNMLALISPHQLLFRYVFKDNKQTSQVGRYGRRVQNQHLINTSFDESGRNDSLPVCDTMALFTTHPLSEKLQQLWI